MNQYHIKLEAGRTEKNYWKDIWQYRELFWILAMRDVSVKYKQTAIGILWALIRPMLTMIIFAFVFGRVAKLPVNSDEPYILMVAAGMLPWQLFSIALSEASMSLVNNANLIGKVYFPRLIVPFASVISAFIDFLISLSLLFGMMVYFNYWPDWRIIFLPVMILLALLASIGPGLLITAWNVKFRDFRYIIPFIVQFGLYVSPVGFNSTIIPEKWRLLYNLNPIVSVIDGFRWCLLKGNADIQLDGFLLGMAVIVVMLFLGFRNFRKMERSFADII